MPLNKIEFKIIKILLNSKFNSEIAHYYSKAQKKCLEFNNYREAYPYKRLKNYHYLIKDSDIKKIIKILNGMKHSHIKYKIENGRTDQNGYPCSIIYFHFKWNERSWQISFHSYSFSGKNKGDQTLFWHGELHSHPLQNGKMQQKFYYEISRILNKRGDNM